AQNFVGRTSRNRQLFAEWAPALGFVPRKEVASPAKAFGTNEVLRCCDDRDLRRKRDGTAEQISRATIRREPGWPSLCPGGADASEEIRGAPQGIVAHGVIRRTQ